MTITVPHIMRRVRNYFPARAIRREWLIQGGTLYPKDIIPANTWIAITAPGPAGVYRLDENSALPGVPERQWTGDVHILTPPADFLALCDDIIAWGEKQSTPTVKDESFGEYSVTYQNQAHAPDWQQAFAASLAPYVRMYPEVDLG